MFVMEWIISRMTSDECVGMHSSKFSNLLKYNTLAVFGAEMIVNYLCCLLVICLKPFHEYDGMYFVFQ